MILIDSKLYNEVDNRCEQQVADKLLDNRSKYKCDFRHKKTSSLIFSIKIL